MPATSTIECLYCAQPTPRSAAAHMTCPSCRKQFDQEFGPDWHQQPWHRELLPEAVRFQHETDRLAHAVRLDADNAPEISADSVVIGTPSRVKYPSVFDAVFSLYVTSRMGARQIKRRLDEEGVKPTVSLRTVSNYVALAKQQVEANVEVPRGTT